MSEQIACSDQLGNQYTFAEADFIKREAVYGVAISEGKVLLVQDSISGNWEVPGGAKDEAEADYACLAREFYEETGLILGDMLKEVDSFVSYFFDLNSRQPWKTKRSFWLVTVASGTIRAHGNDEDVQRADKIPIASLSETQIEARVAKAIGRAILAAKPDAEC